MNVMQEALRLHAAYPLVLCDGKAPRGRRWEECELTEAIIRQEFADKPEINFGMILGRRSMLIDIEIDSPEQEQAFAQLFAGTGIPKTPAWQSSRGCHYLFKWHPDFADLAAAVVHYKGQAIDYPKDDHGLGIRIGNKAAQSIIPPSGGRTWLEGQSLDDCEAADLPAEVRQRIVAAALPAANAGGSRSAAATGAGLDRCVAAMLALDVDDHKDGSHRLFVYANRIVEHDLTDDEAIRAIERCHAVKPFPQTWTPTEILARVRDAEKNTQRGKALRKAKKADPAGVLVKLALQGDDEFFHGTDGQAYVVTTRHNKPETLLINEDAYQNQLRIRYTKATGEVIKNDQLRNATQQLKAIATEERPEFAVHVRVAEHDGTVYIDIGDAARTIVAVTCDGWRLVQTAPVRFRRPPSQAPLAIPETGGSLDELWALVNMPLAERPLFAGWLCTCLYPHGPYPLATLVGPPGSAKTATARVATDIVDATVVTGAAGAESLVDLMIAAQNRHLIVFDNVSKLEQWLQDGCCRLSTGGALTRRRLYSDGEEVVFRAKRPVLITSVGDVITAPDLLDRTLRFELPALTQRLPEAELNAQFALVRGRITGVLLDGVASIVRNIGSTSIADLPRLADFAKAATAAEEGLGLASGSVMEAFRANHADIHAGLLESELAKSIREHCGDGFEGTMTELAKKIGCNQASTLGRDVRQLMPALAGAGFIVTIVKSDNRRVVRIVPRDRGTARDSSSGNSSVLVTAA